jgi:large subunit ribosomal protein L10
MPRPEKVQAVEEIRRRLTEARATFVTEYRGLSVSEQQSLRAELRKADGDYKVVKMSLARLAADAEGLESLQDALVGPTALAFATTDAVTVAKALRDFAREHEHLIIKAGVLSGEVLPPEKVAELADIEPRDVLLGRIAGGFQAPLAKLAGLLQAFPRNAASMFSQLLEKKEAQPAPSEAPAAPEEAAEPETAAEPEVKAPAPKEKATPKPKAKPKATPEAKSEPETAAEPEVKAPAPKEKATPKPKAKPKATDTKEE